MSSTTLRRAAPLLALLAPLWFAAPLWLAAPSLTFAQLGAAPAPAPADPRAAAPQDFTGYWVAVVTEDWRFRMLTPDKGDFAGVPLNAEGRKIADQWDPKRDEANGEQCRSYGAAAIMRVPERLHITWTDSHTLRIETDAGQQVRLLHFGGAPSPSTTPSWQGYSVADWEGLRPRTFVGTVAGGLGAAKPYPEGYLKVVTTQLRPGYLRKNGVPYGPQTSVLEYLDSFKEPNGDRWLVVTTVVTDPEYLAQPFVTSSHFKKIADGSGWHPTPCEAQ